MSSTAVIISICVLYLGLCLLFGMLPGRRASDSAAGYVAGDRSIGLFVLYFITGATIFSAFAFLGAPARAYSQGGAAYYVFGYGVLGFLPFYCLGPRAARLGRAYGLVTQAQMVARRFRQPRLAIIMAAVSVLAFIPYLALQMKGAGYVLEVLTDGAISYEVGAAIVYGIVLIYVLKSGVLGVGWTNTFQGLFMMVLAWVLGLYLPYQLYGGVGEMFRTIASERPDLLTAPGLTAAGDPWPWSEYSSAVLVSAIGFTVWPHLFMKAFTARSEQTIRRTVLLYPTFQIFLVPIFLIGFAGICYSTAPERADQIVPHLLTNLELPAILVGLFCAGALAASMSSGDAMAHACASIAVRDGYVVGLRRELSPERERALIRWALLATILISYLFALFYRDNIVNMLLFAYGPVVQFAPAVWATLYLRRVSGGALFWGLVGGTIAVLVFHVQRDWRPYALHPGIYGLLVNVTLVVLLSLEHRNLDEEEERFLAVASNDPSSGQDS